VRAYLLSLRVNMMLTDNQYFRAAKVRGFTIPSSMGLTISRARKIGSALPQSITKSNEPMQSTIQNLFKSVEQDLQGINAYRYQRQISGGIQEYMEAVLFQHYLETEKVMTYDDASRATPGNVNLTHGDYLLGLFDMTGELMRYAVTYLATNGSLPGADNAEQHEPRKSSILTDMQLLRSYLETMDASSSYGLVRDFEQKLKTTRASVEKVEYGVYSMLVRGKERPKGWRPDAPEGPREGDEIESY
jgi:predicted translin family RNA/ssDNA-binding protein